MAQLILTAVGSTYGPVGAFIGSVIGGAIDGALAPDQQGPRLTDLKVTTSAYGTNRPLHFGTVRTTGNVIWAPDLTEVEGSGKGGPSTTTFAYFATFALSFGEGTARGIRRLWANNILVYDTTLGEANPAAVELDFTFYPGTADQLPDPTIEAALGDTPAYRDDAYAVFVDVPLESFGNRLPNIEAELIMEGEWFAEDQELFDEEVVGAFVTGVMRSDGIIIGVESGGGAINLIVFDPVTGERLAESPYTMVPSSTTDAIYVSATNEIWVPADGIGGGYERFDAETLLHLGATDPIDALYHVGGAYYDPVRELVLGLAGISLFFGYRFVAYNLDGSLAIDYGTVPACDYLTGGGEFVCVGIIRNGLFITFTIDPAVATYDGDGNPLTYVSPFIDSIADAAAFSVVWDPTRRYYVAVGASVWTITDEAVPVVVEFNPAGYSGANVTGVQYVGGLDIIEVFYTSGGSTNVYVLDGETYEVLFNGVVGAIADGYTIVGAWSSSRQLPGIANVLGATRPLQVNVYGTSYAFATSKLARHSGVLTVDDIDVSELGQRLNGYSVASPGPVRAAIEQLARADHFDGVEVDDQLRFPRRGGASVATITLDELAAGVDEAAAQVYVVSRTQEINLPAKMFLTHIDPFTDFQPGTQTAERLAHHAGEDRSETFAVVLTTTQAKRLADRRFFDLWASREYGVVSTWRKYLRLVPTDVITLVDRRVRVTTRTDEGGPLKLGWIADDAEVILQTDSVGAAGLFPGQTIRVIVPTTFILLDTALLRDADDVPGAYIASYGRAPDWRGMSLYVSADGGFGYSSNLALGTPGSSVGTSTTALGDWGGGNVFDETNSITVRMANGAPSGTTRLAVLNGANFAAVESSSGWEVLQYRDVVLNGNGTYTLTGLLRGRSGTEWAMAGHGIGDRVVLLAVATIRTLTVDSSVLGLERHYKAVSLGDTLSGTPAQAETITGERLECWSPVHLGGGRDESANLSLEWVRRTRVGGAWRDNVDASLGEGSEAYAVDIYTSAARTALARTITAATQAAEYTAAQQTTDFGSAQATVYWSVAQISETVGRGHAAHGTT